jgi:thioesterase domain-containing protein/acyl carrier protein
MSTKAEAQGVCDRTALAQVSQEFAPARANVETNEIERRLLMMLRQTFDVDEIGIDDDFFELDGDSLLAAGLFARIEQEFGQTLALDVLFERPTIRLLAELLANRPAELAAPAVVTIQEGKDPQGGSAPPLFCLPGIGGNVLEFRALAAQLDPSQTVYGVPPLGLIDDQPPHASVAEMAGHVIRQMRQLQPTGPYHLVGYSLGGVIAFEVGLQLRAAGERVGLLALFDALLWTPPVSLSLPQKLKLHMRNLWHNSNAARILYLGARLRLLKERLRRRDFRRADNDFILGLKLSAASRRVAEVHWDAWRDYRPRVYDGKLTLFVAEQRPEFAFRVELSDSTLGWSRWTTHAVDVHRAPGTHLDVVRAARVQALVAQLPAIRAREPA